MAWVSLGRLKLLLVYGVHHAHHQACFQLLHQGTPLPLRRSIPSYFNFIYYVKLDLGILIVVVFPARLLLLETAVHRLLGGREQFHEVRGAVVGGGELLGAEGHSAHSFLGL